MAEISIKTIQYRQIDFLRLFRLCRDRGIVRRKRKMPTQYDRASHVNSSCSKLFKSFLTSVFEDAEITPNTRGGTYLISNPEGAADRLRWLGSKLNILRSREDCAEVTRRFEDLTSGVRNNVFVRGGLSDNYRSIRVSVTPQSNGRYSNVYNSMPNANYNVHNFIARPPEEYYRCAKACLGYKELWNEHIGFLCSFVDRERDRIEQEIAAEQAERLRISREEQDRLQREREEQLRQRREDARIESERQEQVRNQAQQAQEQSRQRAQQLFDQALAARRGVEA